MREVTKKLISHEINDLLLKIKNQSLTGSLNIKSSDGLDWVWNLRLGRFGWLSGGNNFQERWERYLDLYCSKSIESPEIKTITSEYSLDKECNILLKLQGNRYITRQDLGILMTSVAQEILFDVVQYLQNSGNNLSYEFNSDSPNSKLGLLLPSIEIETVIAEVERAGNNWNNAGLGAYSPNLFPVIKQPQILQEQISSSSLSSITSLIDGTLSLRNLAIKSNCNLVSLTKYLVSMADLGALSFSQVSAKSQAKFSSPIQKKNIQVSPKEAPLIVCVDDSPLICQALEKIILKHGYRFMSIQEPAKVVLTILKHKPDFIFLDLLMPIVNGYELCTQLRRSPKLQDIPITILTAKDGLVDRMRAKLAGSTDFMSKPVEEELVIAMLNKHLKIERDLV